MMVKDVLYLTPEVFETVEMAFQGMPFVGLDASEDKKKFEDASRLKGIIQNIEAMIGSCHDPELRAELMELLELVKDSGAKGNSVANIGAKLAEISGKISQKSNETARELEEAKTELAAKMQALKENIHAVMDEFSSKMTKEEKCEFERLKELEAALGKNGDPEKEFELYQQYIRLMKQMKERFESEGKFEDAAAMEAKIEQIEKDYAVAYLKHSEVKEQSIAQQSNSHLADLEEYCIEQTQPKAVSKQESHANSPATQDIGQFTAPLKNQSIQKEYAQLGHDFS